MSRNALLLLGLVILAAILAMRYRKPGAIFGGARHRPEPATSHPASFDDDYDSDDITRYAIRAD
jgi:hypothetical protein